MKILENKFFWAGAIVVLAVGVGFFGTLGNRRWLTTQLLSYGQEEASLKNKSTSELRQLYLEMSR